MKGMETVAVLIECLIDNYRANGGQFSFWEDAAQIADVFNETLNLEEERKLNNILLFAKKIEKEHKSKTAAVALHLIAEELGYPSDTARDIRQSLAPDINEKIKSLLEEKEVK